MRILAGGPARETESELYRLHRRCLERQGDLEVRHDVRPDPGGPKWYGEKIANVARSRQSFLEDAEASYDALFMVDTDLILGPGVLDRLLEVDADVVYGVFWSRWPGFEAPMPQVWDEYPYGHTRQLIERMRPGLEFTESRWGYEYDSGQVKELEVLGGGACTLIRGDALGCKYHPPYTVLSDYSSGDMWVGEDRTFGLSCITSGIRQVAVMGLPIVHLDTPTKQDSLSLKEAEEMVGWTPAKRR